MNKIPELLLYLFFGMTILLTGFRFYRTKEWQTLTPKRTLSSWRPLLFTVLPIAGLLLFGKLGNLTMVNCAPYFVGAALLAYVLSQANFSGEIRSLLLLMASVALTTFMPTEYQNPMLGTMGGLLAWKLTENLMHKPESRLDDVLAPMVWLTTVYWAKLTLPEVPGILAQCVVLSTLFVAVFIRWVQPILLPRDTIYLKRLMLALTGGLALLIVFTKVLTSSTLTNTVILGGSGFMLTYLLQSLDRSVDDTPNLARGIKNVLLVGIATLAATRLFGMQGLLVLAAATVLAPLPGSALVAGFFFLSRVLIECYVFAYNQNVTGINLMHTYTSAALYAGFLMVVLGSVFIKDLKSRVVLTCIFLGSIIVLPAATNFFLHPEPTSSFLVSLGVASVLASLLAPAIYPSFAADQENLILLPAVGSVVAIASYELIEIGNNATTHDRLMALGGIAALVAILAVISKLATSPPKQKTPPVVDAASA